jgi:hypothetical protein
MNTFEDFLNVPSKRNGHKNLERKKYFLLASCRSLLKRSGSGAGSGSVSQRFRSEDPDPFQTVTDPEHCKTLIQQIGLEQE